jgi:hypothetical protein
MTLKTLTIGLLLSSFCLFPSQASVFTNLNYIHRDDNRHEGITPTPISGSLSLVSLTTRGIDNLSDTLTVRIPYSGNPAPRLTVLELNTRYRMEPDRDRLFLESGFYTFRLPTNILHNLRIPATNLLAIAKTTSSPVIYLPVMLGQPGSNYELVFHSQRPTKFRLLEIRRNGQVFYRESRNSFERNVIRFTWNGRNMQDDGRMPTGRYELYYEVEIAQVNSSELFSRSVFIQHNQDFVR